MRTVVGIGLVLAVVLTTQPAQGQSRKAFKTLNLLKQVDGAGSGLDADRVQGMAPSDLVSQAVSAAVSQAASLIGNTLASAYTIVNTSTISPGFCGCIQAECTSGDFLFNCGGGVDNDGSAFLTDQGEDEDAAGTPFCRACGCTTTDFLSSAIGVTAVCLDL